jgi:glutamate-5-semialdehyde dehydrogenase
MEDVTRLLTETRRAAPQLAAVADDARNAVLQDLAKNLVARADEIIAANQKDLARMAQDDPRYDRLLLDAVRIQGIADDVAKVATLPAPTGKVLEQRTLDNGLSLSRISVPLGVVGVIYESRPNVTVDVFALCFKAGNAAVLKGGKEADDSNRALMAVIHDTLRAHHLPVALCCLLPAPREATHVLLNAVGLVDICIPRGSQGLIDFVRDTAKIPVIETGAGIVHTYFDASGDVEKGQKIITNAKTRRVSVCNALDTLVVHQSRLQDLPTLLEKLPEKNVEVFADAESHAALAGHYPAHLLHAAQEADFGREFLDYKMSVKTVPDMESALAHIAAYSSQHSEAIVAEDAKAIETFLNRVDAAAVYANASTAFTDGAQFGMGAEIGISTQKLHARGPMALDALTSYKWVIRGNGQTRG